MLSLIKVSLAFYFIFFNLAVARAQETECTESETYDVSMAMCMPLPTKDKPVSRLTVQGNSFFTGITESGPRGRTAFSVPHFFMGDLGTSVGDSHYLNLEYMGTLERWTTPDAGYPELLQIGEENNQGVPYLDAQHPHSSPVMGLTLSDTIRFNSSQNGVKIFFSPRGESTDGPVAFMHRTTGMANPDAPLGHHIGQDVGHISSTVFGESFKWNQTQIEASTFYGAEPQPQNVDLPMETPNSYAFRLIENFSQNFKAMASYAYVSNPEPNEPNIAFITRTSASIYNQYFLPDSWNFDNTLIWGETSNYDQASTLNSFTEEFLFKKNPHRFWGRLEALQRTPAELQIATGGDPNLGLWVFAYTLGYTHRIIQWTYGEGALGISVTNDILPSAYQGAYGGNPWSAKIFLQVDGLKTWDL